MDSGVGTDAESVGGESEGAGVGVGVGVAVLVCGFLEALGGVG